MTFRLWQCFLGLTCIFPNFWKYFFWIFSTFPNFFYFSEFFQFFLIFKFFSKLFFWIFQSIFPNFFVFFLSFWKNLPTKYFSEFCPKKSWDPGSRDPAFFRLCVNTVETVVTVKTAKTEDLKKCQLLTPLLTQLLSDNLKARDASASKNCERSL